MKYSGIDLHSNDCLATVTEQEISDRHSCLSLKKNLEGVCIPSQIATVETPTVRKGSQASHLS
jgi:hypothetical protein